MGRTRHEAPDIKNLQSLVWLEIFVFAGYVLDAGTVLLGIKIVMTNDHCTRIAAVEVCQ